VEFMENRFVLELLKTGCGGHEVMTHDGKKWWFTVKLKSG
jgi:hypothetical protein